MKEPFVAIVFVVIVLVVFFFVVDGFVVVVFIFVVFIVVFCCCLVFVVNGIKHLSQRTSGAFPVIFVHVVVDLKSISFTSLLHLSFDGLKLISELGEKARSFHHTTTHLS